MESRLTLLSVDNDMGQFTVSKQSNILADDKEPSSELGSIPQVSLERPRAMEQQHWESV